MKFSIVLLLLFILALCIFEITAKSHRHRHEEEPEEEEKSSSHHNSNHHRRHRKYGDDEVSDETSKPNSSPEQTHHRHHSKKPHVGPDTDSSRTAISTENDPEDSRSSNNHHTSLNKDVVVPTDADQKFSKGWAPTEIFWSSDDLSNGYNGNVRSDYPPRRKHL